MIDALTDWIRNLDLADLATYTVAVQLLGIAAAIEAVMKTRTSQGAVAWSLSLVLMPTVMLPLYWVFGRRKFRGYAKARRIGKTGIQIPRHTLQMQPASQAPDESLSTPQRALERIVQMPYTRNNSLTLLINGEQIFAALFAAIDNAKFYILLEYYIVRDDDIGRQLSDKLIAKAKQGVTIYFLYDEVGSFKLGRHYINTLRAGGVDIRSFHTTKGRRNRLQLNFRNHRKIAVVDGEIGIVGGSNIGDEYLDRHAILTPWRDTSVQIRGPAVHALQLTFLEDWYWACEQVLELKWHIPAEAVGNVEVLIAPTGPADQMETCLLLFQQLAQCAKDRLWIVSPYFVPDTSTISALQLAALRGVDVRILLPENPDKRTVWLSSFASLDEVQSTGVKVYRYQAGFLHQKIWLVDSECALIGTANLDNRSFRLNFEIGVIANNRAFVTEVAAMLERDFGQSRLLPHGEVAKRGWFFRLAVRCSYLFAPIL